MANKKLTDLTELTTPADNDFLYIVDVSDTTDGPQGTSKKIRKDKVDSGASKENIANKSDIYTTDTEKYYSATYVNGVLPTSYSKIIYVNATSPTTATIFDLENPPITNDNALKNDTANLYIGTDASTWVYLTGTGYVTKTISSATSNFNTFGTTADAGNSKTSHITRSGAVTLTGSLNLAVAKISTTPNTSAGSYDILTRNSSTTALEKKSISDFIQTTGSQSKTGKLTMSSTDAIIGGFVNINGATTGSFYVNSNNSTGIFNQSNNSSTGDFNVDRNTSSGRFARQTNESTGNFYSRTNSSTGIFLNQENTSSGVFSAFSNQSTGVFERINSTTASTGNLVEFQKNNVNTTVVNHLGEITTMTPTASGQVSTKGYVDAKITQTITNGVTDKSPSEDAVFDALALKVSGSGTANLVAKFTATGTIANSTITDNGTNVGIGNASGSPAENLEVRTTGNTGFAMTRNTSTNAARFYFKTGATYNWSVGVRSSRNDYSIFNEVSSIETFTINATTNNALIGTTTDNGVAGDKLQVSGAIAVSSTIKAGATVRLKNYTVATLPAGVQGDTAYVTDALSPTYLGVLVGGGAVKCPVFYNGTAWVSH